MSPHNGQFEHHFSSVPIAPDNGEFYDQHSTLNFPPSTEHSCDYRMPENLCWWQDTDGVYHWADAPAARSDNFAGYLPSMYYPSMFPSDQVSSQLDDHTYKRHIHEDIPPPAISQADASYPYLSHLAPQQQVKIGCTRQSNPQSQDHRSSIARASDNFLSQASSLSSDAPVVPRRQSTLDSVPSTQHYFSPRQGTHAPSRKRSIATLEDEHSRTKEEDGSAYPSLSAVDDACCLPQPHMIVPSQSTIPPYRTPSQIDPATSRKLEVRSRQYDVSLRLDDMCPISTPKQFSNKRINRTSEPIRQENTILSTTATWHNPDDPIIKGAKKGGEQKKQALACLFCRERKIACGRPSAYSPDQTCNQCARRRIKCEYPTESRRGQHKRRRKPIDGETSSQDALRTTSSTMSTNPSLPTSSIRVTSSA
ncbi:hypothetical protein F5I97DRAFT_667173 [Phlebopus sp. FC_14]|nr:hypothetical protein F5I97DRAFT_667173 [Phlebopus sp. FC_14]